MSLQELYRVLEFRAYVVLYDINFSKTHEVFQGLSDDIPFKYMRFVVCKLSAQIIDGQSIAYVIEIC